MAYKNRFHKTTLGVDAEVFVAKAVEYSDDATLALFQANAVEGEIALVNAKTNAVFPGPGVAAVAAAAGSEVFVALKRDGNVERSTVFTIGKAVITKQAYVAPVKHKITALSGLTDVAKGDNLELAVIETTPGMQPLPTVNYAVQVKAGETAAQAVARLVALINDAASIENQNKTQIVTATVSGTVDIVLEAKNFGEHFIVALRGKLAEAGSFSATTQFKLGSGTPEQVRLAEQAGDIRKGVTTNYPDQNATPEEFGQATSFVDASTQYMAIVITHETADVTRVLDKETRKNHIFLYIPSNGAANASAEVPTILGV